MASKLLMILSRSARLLECLEFDPAEFYTVLEFEEQELMGSKVHEMGSYIRSKLGIQTPTPVDEKKGEVEEDDSEGGDKPRKVCRFVWIEFRETETFRRISVHKALGFHLTQNFFVAKERQHCFAKITACCHSIVVQNAFLFIFYLID